MLCPINECDENILPGVIYGVGGTPMLDKITSLLDISEKPIRNNTQASCDRCAYQINIITHANKDQILTCPSC